MKIKPAQLSRVLGISTDALRKQRIRDKSPYEIDRAKKLLEEEGIIENI